MQGAQSCKELCLNRDTVIRGTLLYLLAASQNKPSKTTRKSVCCCWSCFTWAVWGFAQHRWKRYDRWLSHWKKSNSNGWEPGSWKKQHDLAPDVAQLGLECIQHHHPVMATVPVSLLETKPATATVLQHLRAELETHLSIQQTGMIPPSARKPSFLSFPTWGIEIHGGSGLA